MSIPAGRSLFYTTFAATPEARQIAKVKFDNYNKEVESAKSIIDFMRQGGDSYRYDIFQNKFVDLLPRSKNQMLMDFYSTRSNPFTLQMQLDIVEVHKKYLLSQLAPQTFSATEKEDLVAFLNYKIGTEAKLSFYSPKFDHALQKAPAGTFKPEEQKKSDKQLAKLRKEIATLEKGLIDDKKRLVTIDSTYDFEEFQWRLGAVQIPPGLAADVPARLEVLKKMVTELHNGTFSLEAYLDVVTWDGFVKGFLDSGSYFLGPEMLEFKMDIVNMAADSNRRTNQAILSSQRPTELKIAALRAEIESL